MINNKSFSVFFFLEPSQVSLQYKFNKQHTCTTKYSPLVSTLIPNTGTISDVLWSIHFFSRQSWRALVFLLKRLVYVWTVTSACVQKQFGSFYFHFSPDLFAPQCVCATPPPTLAKRHKDHKWTSIYVRVFFFPFCKVRFNAGAPWVSLCSVATGGRK